jgi:hypothetical protein
MMPGIPIALLFACILAGMTTSSRAENHLLFDSAENLDIVIEFPVRTLLKRARKKPVLQGQLRYVDVDGNEVAIDIDITTRGRSRLEHCSFPPLSVFLNPDQVASTLFAGQKKLKIVTHCNNGSTYLRYLHQEFGIYKTYNLVSEYSFRVRMLNVTYRDIEGKRRDDVRLAFFIESDNEVAKRLGMKKIKTKTIAPHQFDAAQTNIFELFQYLIANTDWAIKKGPGTENCCHNAKVIAKPDAQDNWIVLPYDFDQAGIINTKYALPALSLGIRTVRHRLYRGRCRHNDYLDQTIQLFNERRADIEIANTPDALSNKARKSTLKYLDVFYKTINDPEKLKKRIVDVCRGA